MIIYKLTSPSGKVYIGQSKYDLETRWQQHLRSCQSNGKKTKLKHALNKYNPETWTKEVLLECDQEEASFHEQDQIERHDSYRNGYNMTLGGEGLNGADFSDEHRIGIAKAKQSWWDSPAGQAKKKEFSEKCKQYNPGAEALRGKPAWNSGRKMPERTKEDKARTSALLSEKLKGKKRTSDQIENIRKSQIGKKLSQKHKDAISKGGLGRKQTETQKEAARNANACRWEITHPNGLAEIIHNLNAFCREHNLTASNFSTYGKTKGYRAVRLSGKGEDFHK